MNTAGIALWVTVCL